MKIALPAAAALLLAGCLEFQLGGSVTSASVTIAPLRDPGDVILATTVPSLDDQRLAIGAETWDRKGDQFKLVFSGYTSVDKTLFEEQALYLVTASGGFDQDSDTDARIDDTAEAVDGQWHAILTGKQLANSIVNPLTETVYRAVEAEIDSLDDDALLERLDEVAQTLVVDTDGSGTVDYRDTLLWNRYVNPDSYLRDLSLVDELAAAVRGGADAVTVRDLGRRVQGLPPLNGGAYDVSGSITVASSTRVDSDVNNPSAHFADNSSQDTPQQLINPVVLGGYANLAGEGESGASFDSGDLEDVYRVDLLQGQVISLIMADDPSTNDLDLYLYDAAGELVDASLGLSEIEQLTVPEDGEYLLSISAFAGASNYQLTLGIGELAQRMEHMRLSDDFMPGEIIARFREDRRNVDSMAKRERFTGMRARGGLRRANLLRLPEPARKSNSLQKRKLRTLLELKRLRRLEEVESADLNYRVRTAAVPNDVFYNRQSWHYNMINLPAAWDRSLGDDVIVAVIDTGVRLNHPDLQDKLLPGYDFVSVLSLSVDGDGIDDNPDDPGSSTGSTRSTFHGTHVAGTIAAATNNQRGVAGVAWNARIMPLRALGAGGGTTYDVLQSVRYAAALPNDSGTVPSRPADVINLSLGGSGFSFSAQSLYSQVASRGIIIVAAAGNDSTSEPSYPAAYEDVFSVSAVDINKARASYSNFGDSVDIAAPGGDSRTRDVNGDGIPDLILSTAADDSVVPIQANYELLQGTSMATPHVAGVAALMKAVHPALDVQDFRDLLQTGLLTDDLGSSGRDDIFGYGLVNANKAVIAAESLASGSGISQLPSVSTSLSALNFGEVTATLPLTISNGGTGELIISAVTAQDSWLMVEALDTDGNGLGSYQVSVDRSALEVGSYRSSLSIASNVGTDTIAVIMQKPDPDAPTDGDAGLHYILLLNADTGELEQEISVRAEAGEYRYQFIDVPAGNYQIIAGSDADNDFFICDAGEACGAFPVLDSEPVVIEVDRDIEGLDFSTTFFTGIISESSSASAGRPGLRRPRFQR